MNITTEWLKEKRACYEGVKWFEEQTEKDGVKVVEKLMEENQLDWANWLIVRIMTYRQYVSYAVFAAEQLLDAFEKRYPDDKRPRQAIKAAKKCVENPSDENKVNAATTAANAANAAYAAANAAVAGEKMKREILECGLKLLKESK